MASMSNPDLAGMMMTKDFEGWRDKTYKDTLGNPTIGWGFNIVNTNLKNRMPADVLAGNRGLTQEEASPVFNELYANAKNVAKNYVGQDTYDKLTEGQKNVLHDMAYNMNDKLNSFKKMKMALVAGDYQDAASELKNSKWYGQVGRRGKNHYIQIQQ